MYIIARQGQINRKIDRYDKKKNFSQFSVNLRNFI